MWLHIRGVGEWTNRLYEYFEKKQEKLHNGEIPQLADHHKRLSNGSINNNNQNPIKKIQSTITRTLSKREKQKPVVQLVGFDPVNDELTNQKATCSTTGRI